MCIYYDKLDKVFYLLKNLSEFKWEMVCTLKALDSVGVVSN